MLALGQFDAVARVTGYAAVLDRRTQDLPQQTERVLDRRHHGAVGDQLRHVRPARAPGAARRHDRKSAVVAGQRPVRRRCAAMMKSPVREPHRRCMRRHDGHMWNDRHRCSSPHQDPARARCANTASRPGSDAASAIQVPTIYLYCAARNMVHDKRIHETFGRSKCQVDSSTTTGWSPCALMHGLSVRPSSTAASATTATN